MKLLTPFGWITDLFSFLFLAVAFCWAQRSLQRDADRHGDA